MRDIILNTPASINVSPEQIAFLFCEMSSDQMAIFFNKVADITAEWENPLDAQLAAVENSWYQQQKGANIMRKIGDYSNFNPVSEELFQSSNI